MTKVHALIFAGGTGQRMNTRTTPKQFLELHGKPVIIYTIEHFERHSEVDDIAVVCLASWIDELQMLLRRYDITKVRVIVPGGETGDESVRLGLAAMGDIAADDDVVLIHDGVRPLVNAGLISENIAVALEHRAAITVESVRESVVQVDENGVIEEVPPRHAMHVAKAPQTFRYGLIRDLYRRAEEDGVGAVDSAHLCSVYGVAMRTVQSSPNNLKITAPHDYYIFRALHEVLENQQILGV